MTPRLTELSAKWYCLHCTKRAGVVAHVWSRPCGNADCPRKWTAEVDAKSNYCSESCGLVIAKQRFSELKRDELTKLYGKRLDEWAKSLIAELEHDDEMIKAQSHKAHIVTQGMDAYDEDDLADLVVYRQRRDECKLNVRTLVNIAVRLLR